MNYQTAGEALRAAAEAVIDHRAEGVMFASAYCDDLSIDGTIKDVFWDARGDWRRLTREVRGLGLCFAASIADAEKVPSGVDK